MSEHKSIETVVEDIYSLFSDENERGVSDADMEAFIEQVCMSVRRSIEEKRDRRANLRLSLVGQPDRKIWYEINQAPQETLSSSTRIKFLFGDILEALLVLLTRTSGHEVTDEQKEVEVNGVVGHIDGKIDGTLVDFKSASPFGFRKFKYGHLASDDPFGYIAQISSYAKAEDAKEAGFLAIDKSNGEIAYLPIHDLEMINAEERIEKVRGVVGHSTPPDRCYSDIPDGKSGNRRLDIGCVYCSFKRTCWSDANNGEGLRAFKYSNGVRYLTATQKLPDVEEVPVDSLD
jgi:hypothetical protein